MKKNIFTYIIEKRKITFCLIFLIILIGLFSYVASPKQENPQVTPPVALITCIYPGAGPMDVEKLVSIPIEKAISDIPGYYYASSTSKKNLSTTILWLKNDADVDKAWQELETKLRDVEKDLPEECQSIKVDTDLANAAGVMVCITSQQKAPGQLVGYSEKLEEAILKIQGISKVETVGIPREIIEIEVDVNKLAYYQISLDDIAKALAAQNVTIPSGYIEENSNRIQVNAPGGYQSLADMENMIVQISKETGAPLRMKDLATVKKSTKSDELQIEEDGIPGLLVAAYFEQNINVLTLSETIHDTINLQSEKFPNDVMVDTILFQPEEIQGAVNNFMRNLICGVLLVLAVVWIGMSYRNALVISTVIPLSILMTFIAMYIGKVPVHEISTAGLIIALGMLVDNSIVVSDAIQNKLDAGEEKLWACANGAKESALPILSATLTTIAAFFPLIMMSGTSGTYIFSVPFTVIVALIASYLNAMITIPALAFVFFRPYPPKKKDYLQKIRKFFDKLLALGLSNKKKTLLLSGLLMCMAVFMLIQMGLSFFPYADKDIMHIRITSENSNNIEKTKAAAKEVEKIIKEQPQVINYTTSIGGGLPKFFITADKIGQNPGVAQIMMRIDLSKSGNGPSEKNITNNENESSQENITSNGQLAAVLQRKIDAKLVGASAVVKQLEHSEPSEAPVKIRVYGDQMEDLVEAEKLLIAGLKKIPATLNVRSDLGDKEFQYYINVNQDTASRMGVTNYDIQRQLNIALNGYKASVYRDGKNKEFDMILKGNIKNAEELKKLPIASSITGSKVYLEQLGTLELKSEFPQIERYDRNRSITVLSDILPGQSAVAVEKEMSVYIDEISQQCKNVTFVFDGEGAKIDKYFGDALKFAFLAVLLIYFIMMVQFYSFKQPFIVMGSMPLAILGSIFGLFLFRQTLSFTALLGMISLMGIVVNNAILLIDFVNKAETEGMDGDSAIRFSVDRRFRPIMISTVTTVIGLTPLALSGSGLFTPMSIALMSGLIISTVLTLIFIPVLLSLTNRTN